MDTNTQEGFKRPQVSQELINQVVYTLIQELESTIEKKGKGIFISPHEAFGAITEEYDELKDELRSNDLQAFTFELRDVAVSCIWALVSAEFWKKNDGATSE